MFFEVLHFDPMEHAHCQKFKMLNTFWIKASAKCLKINYMEYISVTISFISLTLLNALGVMS